MGSVRTCFRGTTWGFLCTAGVFVLIAVLLEVNENIPYDPFEGPHLTEDEDLLFFDTVTAIPEDKEDAVVLLPVHGWVFEKEPMFPFNYVGVLFAIGFGRFINFRTGGTLSEALGEYEYNLLRLRSKMFFVDNQRGKELAVTVCNTTHALPVSDPTGHIEGHISIQRSALLSCTAPGFEISAERIKVPIVHTTHFGRIIQGTVILLPSRGVSVISDIDDTIRITDVYSKALTLRSTFMRDFIPVDGMAAMYKRLKTDTNCSFHYVSGTPWPLYHHIHDYLKDHGFPEVGDSGEHDPELYGECARNHKDQVVMILIRKCKTRFTHGTGDRFAAAFQDVPRSTWLVFEERAEIDSIDIRSRLKL